MIDIENDVFDVALAKLREYDSDICVMDEYIKTPSSFPAVTIVENDNSVVERMRTTHIENAVHVMYECNIFSNRVVDKKTEAKEIASVLDSAFEELGFTRTFRNQIPNFDDASIHRIVCRYEGVVGPGDNYRFLVYQN